MIISARFASMEWRILNQSHRKKWALYQKVESSFLCLAARHTTKTFRGRFLVQNICVKCICRVIIQLV